jgi:hypothetical protein
MRLGPNPLLTLALPLLAACGSEGSGPLPAQPVGKLELGTGALTGEPGFVSVSEGADVPLAAGAQGGFHVYVNVRLDADGAQRVGPAPVLNRSARRVSDGTLVSRSRQRVELGASASAPGSFESLFSIPLFLCPTPVGVEVAGQLLELELTAGQSDDDPDPMVARLRFVPRCPDDGGEEFCRSICSG